MYKVHHDATLLPIELQCGDYPFGGEKIPALNVSASKDKSGRIHITLCNLDPQNSAKLVCEFQGTRAEKISGRALTADAMTAHNTFDNPEAISPVAFDNFQLKGNILTVTLPPRSVVLLGIE
jgi:alpha-N-arabinofuranosidase